MSNSFKYKLGANEFKSKDNNLLLALLAEFLGTFLLNFFGCAACIRGDNTVISLAFGLTVFMVIMAIGHISGGHINPAVTCGMLIAGKISVLRALFYIIAQCAGATAGTASLKALLDESIEGGLGHTALANKVLPVQGLGFEFFLGFILVFTVFGVCDENKPNSKFIAPLAIGLAVTVGHLGVVSFTGSSMNPARSFGTAAITGNWENHWVYWVGPILGGIAASLLYTLAFSAPDTAQDKYRTNADEKELRRLDGKGEFA